MKKLISLILCLSMCFCILGCSSQKETLRSPVSFYYRTKEIKYNTASGVISAEKRESFGHEEDIAYLIELYLNGPVTQNCISPFPAGTKLEQLDILKNKAVIVLSSHISLLSGSELTIACTCLARTLLELTDVKEVKIISKDDLLDGKESITIGSGDFFLQDEFRSDP